MRGCGQLTMLKKLTRATKVQTAAIKVHKPIFNQGADIAALFFSVPGNCAVAGGMCVCTAKLYPAKTGTRRRENSCARQSGSSYRESSGTNYAVSTG